MKPTEPQLVRTPREPMTQAAFAHLARTIVAHHGERILAEVPRTLRRVGLFLLILSITMPAFCLALLVVLWHLGN